MKDVNYRIAHWRKLSGFNQTDLAEKLGIKCNTYSQMERTGNVSADRLFKLAEIFGVKPCYLFYGEKLCKTETKNAEPTIIDGPVTKPDNGTTLQQPKPEPPKEPPFVFTNREESLIKMYRSLKKDDRASVVNLIHTLYQNKGK